MSKFSPGMIVLLLISLISNLANAQSKHNAKVDSGFQQKLPLWMAEYHVPAVGIGIIENGRLKETKVFGELRKGIPAPADTLFEMASLTKPIVAMLTLRL